MSQVARPVSPTPGSVCREMQYLHCVASPTVEWKLASPPAELLQRLSSEKGLPLPVLARILDQLHLRNLSAEELADQLSYLADECASLQIELQRPAPAEYEPVRERVLKLFEEGDLDGVRQQLRAARVAPGDWAAQQERRMPKFK